MLFFCLALWFLSLSFAQLVWTNILCLSLLFFPAPLPLMPSLLIREECVQKKMKTIIIHRLYSDRRIKHYKYPLLWLRGARNLTLSSPTHCHWQETQRISPVPLPRTHCLASEDWMCRCSCWWSRHSMRTTPEIIINILNTSSQNES